MTLEDQIKRANDLKTMLDLAVKVRDEAAGHADALAKRYEDAKEELILIFSELREV